MREFLFWVFRGARPVSRPLKKLCLGLGRHCRASFLIGAFCARAAKAGGDSLQQAAPQRPPLHPRARASIQSAHLLFVLLVGKLGLFCVCTGWAAKSPFPHGCGARHGIGGESPREGSFSRHCFLPAHIPPVAPLTCFPQLERSRGLQKSSLAELFFFANSFENTFGKLLAALLPI